MDEKIPTSRQKTKRTMLGVKPNEGRLGKRPLKDHHFKDKQKRGDRRTHPTNP